MGEGHVPHAPLDPLMARQIILTDEGFPQNFKLSLLENKFR